MAIVDQTFYSASIAIALASIYFFKYTWIRKQLGRVLSFFQTRLDGGNGKLDLIYLDEIPLNSLNDASTAPEYSSNWWTDERQFQLERRAIFSQSWMFVTHASRFTKPGDYRTFEIVGFSFILILGKDKQLRAFHNVCRHRAYPVTKKESGSSKVLGCRYHGWSYDTKGKLIKAPEFENVPGFDKTTNGLWELKTDVRNSLVFVNFQVGDEEIELELGESGKSMSRWRIDEMICAHEWKMEGATNWKLAADTLFSGHAKKDNISYWEQTIFGVTGESVALSHTACVRQLPSSRILTIKLLPISATKTLIECNIYGRGSRYTKSMNLELESSKKEVQLMIRQSEEKQRAFVQGRGGIDNATLQNELRQSLESYRDDEKKIGAEIHPAARRQSFTPEGIADDELCKELEMGMRPAVCGANATGILDW